MAKVTVTGLVPGSVAGALLPDVILNLVQDPVLHPPRGSALDAETRSA